MLTRPVTTSYSALFRVIAGVLVLTAVISAAAIITLLESKTTAYRASEREANPPVSTVTPFPFSVYPSSQTITEVDDLLPYIDQHLADSTTKPIRTSWWHHLGRKLATLGWYQNFASPSSRILVIWPGDRKEQVVDNFGDILRWSEAERERFQTRVETATGFSEGAFLPGRYTVAVGARPEHVAQLVSSRFQDTVTARYSDELAVEVPLADALVLASLLEREAYDFAEMREIAGVFWNRLFVGMPLQLDASLQYAKANQPYSASWWPVVRPADKFIDSPFNTYQNEGLPPAAIANPSAVTILAVLNPRQTDCMFYFHHSNGDLYCSVDYETHVAELQRLYGRGQ